MHATVERAARGDIQQNELRRSGPPGNVRTAGERYHEVRTIPGAAPRIEGRRMMCGSAPHRVCVAAERRPAHRACTERAANGGTVAERMRVRQRIPECRLREHHRRRTIERPRLDRAGDGIAGTAFPALAENVVY